jgi:two-component system, NtrC family, nitrogen regulation sensor histidine kinase NtrY
MVFKNFRLQIILRVLILVAIVILLAWCVVHHFYLRSVYLAVAMIISIIELIWYVDRFNRDIKTFLISLAQQDFNTHYQAESYGKSFRELYMALNQISAAFVKLSTEKEIQYRYLEMLVEHVRVSILSMDADGKIHLANQAAKNLLRKNVLVNIKSIEAIDKTLAQTIISIKTGETRLIKVTVGNEQLQLSIHTSEFKLEDKYYKLISMQDIRTELDAKEIEAWQKLIRVLSHEIMNSVSPIISLSGTLHQLVQQQRAAINDESHYNTLNSGLDAIKVRSEGLYNFTQSYRKLTGMPRASMKDVDLRTLIDRVYTLMTPRVVEKGITLERTVQEELMLRADPELLEHVLINLITNAIDAVGARQDPAIKISAMQYGASTTIKVLDNGEGIDEAIADKIFVPFFTTRRHGTGIGLALTKQILQVHNAEIYFNSKPGEGTEFVIIF